MSKHTAGPWGIIVGDAGPIVFSGQKSNMVAHCIKAWSSEERMANARLIAAAPDLLEALQRMVANNMPLTGNPSHQQLVEFWEYEKSVGRGEADDMLFVLAAIAKATGEAP